MKDFIITTTNQLEGYIITEYLDVIFEESIFGISISTGIKGLGDMFAGWTGERLHAISNRIEEVKKDVKEALVDKAVRLGADALIGVDIETTRNLNDGTIGVSMSGTTVRIIKAIGK